MTGVIDNLRRCCGVCLMLLATVAAGDYVPPQNLAPESSSIQLDHSYQDDAWLVYAYKVDAQGKVVDARVVSSNGVASVEAAVLEKLSMLQFKPATQGGQPVMSSPDPVIFTRLLDLPRNLSPAFQTKWKTAWAHFREGDYAAASALAAWLGSSPGRNALEEVRYRVLAASLAMRQGEGNAELRHLQKASEFQALARANNFRQRYIESDQYLLILERIQALQLERMMLADATHTLALIKVLGPGSQVAGRAKAAFGDTEGRFNALPEVSVPAELTPLYVGGPGVWKTGLSRKQFSLSDVEGRVDLVYLVCGDGEVRLSYPSAEPWIIPVSKYDCKVDITGTPGTRLVLHQLAR